MPSDPGTLFVVFAVGVAAGTVGVMVGGGSLLSIPLLIFLGLPPQVAIATDRFAGLGAGATALYRFWRAERIVWRFVPVLALASLLGSLLGASALVGAQPDSLRLVVGVLLVALVPMLFVRRDFGVVPRQMSRRRMTLGLALYLGVQVLAGFFGGGTGVLVFAILMSFLGVTITQVAATQTIPFLVLTLSSLLLFAASGIVDYRAGLVLLAGTAVGGYLGANLAIRSGDRWVRRLFALVVLASAARLLFAQVP
jgi:uncharacterized membrane protein YfcA